MYIIGDVHGSLMTLKRLLARLPDKSARGVTFVGDLVDRGPDSFEVVILAMREGYASVMGNHEMMMIASLDSSIQSPFSDIERIWMQNGGDETLNSMRRAEKKYGAGVIEDALCWIRGLPLAKKFDELIDEEGRKLVVSHAALHQTDVIGLSIKEVEPWVLWDQRLGPLWNRVRPLPIDGLYNIFGHTPLKQPLIESYFAMIDTAACYGNRLSAISFPDKRMITSASRG